MHAPPPGTPYTWPGSTRSPWIACRALIAHPALHERTRKAGRHVPRDRDGFRPLRRRAADGFGAVSVDAPTITSFELDSGRRNMGVVPARTSVARSLVARPRGPWSMMISVYSQAPSRRPVGPVSRSRRACSSALPPRSVSDDNYHHRRISFQEKLFLVHAGSFPRPARRLHVSNRALDEVATKG